MKYNEDKLLTTYILKHHKHLLTGLEIRILHAIGHGKTDSFPEGSDEAKKADKYWGSATDAEIDEALFDGIDAFRQRVRDRILKEHPFEVKIARCPKCNKLLRSPTARQCPWCKHDWHLSAM